ncbi:MULTISPECIES: hypothetical protein [unclassified Bradyrhizobium]|uniref:hypothetical protein n=1 Tax=unclassified Bradyrhizobium TaxID=2631580 RepID=UPI0028EC2EAF|nr:MULTISPECIES: hypothetical protein [unclassified Bradyrhizobium]
MQQGIHCEHHDGLPTGIAPRGNRGRDDLPEARRHFPNGTSELSHKIAPNLLGFGVHKNVCLDSVALA